MSALSAPLLLLVDANPERRNMSARLLAEAGYRLAEVADGIRACAMLETEPAIALVLFCNGGEPDIDVASQQAMRLALGKRFPAMPMLMQAPPRTPQLATQLLQTVATALHPCSPASGAPCESFAHMIGQAPNFRATIAMATKAARSNMPVLIDGESGVGKEVLARAVHAASRRAMHPLVVVNCGAIPANLVESVLFGHEKGAFTGALASHIGRFGEADGGTLFLDEVGELPLEAQVKLLRALQTGQIEPVGARGCVMVDVRIIAATNRNLAADVSAGRFREDLFYRLNVVALTLPPLRQRRSDIALLAHNCLAQLAQREPQAACTLTPAALALLEAQEWPGNVRQLQNALVRAAILCDGPCLDVADFAHLAHVPDSPAAGAGTAAPGAPAVPLAGAGGYSLIDPQGHVRRLADIEADAIRAALHHYKGHMSEAARRLGIGRSTLYRKLAELGLAQNV